MAQGVMLDSLFGSQVVNSSDVETGDVFAAMQADPVGGRMLAALSTWTTNTQGGTERRSGGLFERDRYVTPRTVFDQMRLAQDAAENDDIVSGVLESTESLAFSKVSLFSEDEEEEDVYNQIAADIDLDSRLREMWREIFVVGSVTASLWWHNKTYRVRGRSERGVKRKKEMTLRVPKAITILDPLRIIPIGNTMFNQEQLVYIADRHEAAGFDLALENRNGVDLIVERMFLGKYDPSPAERSLLIEWGFSASADLYILNPANTFRHTVTRPQYRRFPVIRMKSCFEILDLKHQLREMDRATILGAANFIVVITKGTDTLPAKPAEIANLQGQVRTVGRVPVLVGDHRLKVEIVTPKLDNTLNKDRYNTLDGRLTARLYQMFVLGTGGSASSGDDSIKLVKMIARGMESRRHMLRRSLEAHVFQPIFDQNESLMTKAKLRYHPKQIALDFDPAFATFLLDLRANHEISRETILSQFDLDQGDEAQMLEREKSTYDSTFLTTIPFDSPGNNQRRGGGQESEPMTPAEQRRAARTGGGNRNGGGSAPGSGQGESPRNIRRTSDAEEEQDD